MKKNKFILLIIISAVAFITIAFTILYLTNSKNTTTSDKFLEQYGISSKDWAFNNIGQTIEEKRGIYGNDINILNAWDITKGSEKVLVGILDTGINVNLDTLKNSIYVNAKEYRNSMDDDKNGYCEDINGWDFFNNDSSVYDSYLHDYHGTQIASIILKVAPKIKIVPLKFMRGTKGTTEDAIKAIEYAHSLGVRIINCSWDNQVYNKRLKDTMEKYTDILFICSAGKNGDDLSLTPTYPACFGLPNIISVVGIDNQESVYSFSSYGTKADLAAPGVDIFVSMPDNEQIFSSGTSLAVPFVTGTAALLKSYKNDISVADMVLAIKTNARKVEKLQGKVSTNGVLDVYSSLKSIQ